MTVSSSPFTKSSYSLAECIEVRRDDETVVVRNSRRPDGPVHEFTAAEWVAFIAGARDGEFDLGFEIPQRC